VRAHPLDFTTSLAVNGPLLQPAQNFLPRGVSRLFCLLLFGLLEMLRPMKPRSSNRWSAFQKLPLAERNLKAVTRPYETNWKGLIAEERT
jgi:hypothetical protein